MARPRSFDENKVLNQVMALFWEKGYGATSMTDIKAATGLKPGSLYDSFGDKQQLFLSAVEHYRNTTVRERLKKLLKPGNPRQRLETFFKDIVTFSLGEGRKLGCLMSNSAVELAPHDATMREIVGNNLNEITHAFKQVIEEGIASGDFTTTESSIELAHFLTSTVQGLRVMAKSTAADDSLPMTTKMALKILG